jgi:U3 small nucleolar RNA-associated protein 18
MNGGCSGASFSADDNYLYSIGDQSEIYQWDLKQRKCVSKIGDEGSF